MNENASSYGAVGLVFSILSLFVFPFIFGVIGVVFGYKGAETSHGIVAFIIGLVSIIFALVRSCYS